MLIGFEVGTMRRCRRPSWDGGIVMPGASGPPVRTRVVPTQSISVPTTAKSALKSMSIERLSEVSTEAS